MTTQTIDPDAFAKLIKVCTQFGGNAPDGTILNAVRAADRLLVSMGLTWQDILMPAEEAAAAVNVNVGGSKPNAPPPPPPSGRPQPQAKTYRPSGGSARANFMATNVPPRDHCRVAAELLRRNVSFRDAREAQFVNDMAASPYDFLHLKPYKWLCDIIARNPGCGVSFKVNPTP